MPASHLGSWEEECILGQPIGSSCCHVLPGFPSQVALPTCLHPPPLAAPLCLGEEQTCVLRCSPPTPHLGTPPRKTKALCLFSKPEPEAIPVRPAWLNGAVSGCCPKARLRQSPATLPPGPTAPARGDICLVAASRFWLCLHELTL